MAAQEVKQTQAQIADKTMVALAAAAALSMKAAAVEGILEDQELE
jgi:hypothetical protein